MNPFAAPALPYATLLPVGVPLPTYRYALTSADEQVRTITYALLPSGEVCQQDDTGWDDEADLLHTLDATLEIAWPGASEHEVLHLSGDEHRDLEDRDLFDSLLRGIASGLPARTVLRQITAALDAA